MSDELAPGAVLELRVRAMAHGGEGIADAPDGRVVFIGGAVPGDNVEAHLTKVKKRWARAELLRVLEPSADRVDSACPAAAAGAGCCDYAHITPEAQLRFKRDVLVGQLGALSRRSGVVADGFVDKHLQLIQLEPVRGWRTRVRMGVDAGGSAGMRRARSTHVIGGVPCSQVAPELLNGIVGPDAAKFTPGSELIAVLDADGTRHVVETRASQRGRRVERVERVVEGPGTVVERVDDHTYSFPPTAFWQAHVKAPETYSALIREWGSDDYSGRGGWDLYGGVGAFVPALASATGGRIDSVDYSASATARRQQVQDEFDLHTHNAAVEDGIDDLPAPGLVVLDPPRAGAGAGVVAKIAQAAPQRVIHIGCDPATFARDLATFSDHGYVVERMALVDAFPNTHHFEVLASLVPARDSGTGE